MNADTKRLLHSIKIEQQDRAALTDGEHLRQVQAVRLKLGMAAFVTFLAFCHLVRHSNDRGGLPKSCCCHLHRGLTQLARWSWSFRHLCCRFCAAPAPSELLSHNGIQLPGCTGLRILLMIQLLLSFNCGGLAKSRGHLSQHLIMMSNMQGLLKLWQLWLCFFTAASSMSVDYMILAATLHVYLDIAEHLLLVMLETSDAGAKALQLTQH